MTPDGLALPPQEGVHLFMHEDAYFDAPALGSSDFLTLFADPASYWYGTPNNPHRRVRVNRANHLNFGSGLHSLLLEGDAAFREKFTVEPDSDDLSWLRTIAEIKRVLRSMDVNTGQEFNRGKIFALAKKHGIAHRCWDLAWSSYEAARSQGASHLDQDEVRRLRHMVRLIKAHPDLGATMAEGISEVTVFFRDPRWPGVLLRARFDKLLVPAIADLKTMSGYRGGDPDEATFSAIIKNGYDLQAEHYRAAREAARAFIREGRIFVWNSEGDKRPLAKDSPLRDTLQGVADADEWRWVWIFYQVRNDSAGSERAPVVCPWFIETDDPMFKRARATIDQAMDNYAAYCTRFTLKNEWSEIRKIRRLPTERLRALEFKRKTDE